jgi:plasmid stability protein
MGQLLVRNLDDDVIERLKARALERGTSLEQVARDALTESATTTDRRAWMAELAALRGASAPDPGFDATAEIRAARDALAARLDPAIAGDAPRRQRGA